MVNKTFEITASTDIKCPICEGDTEFYGDVSGGCGGYCEEYCYCGSPDMKFEVYCKKNHSHLFTVSELGDQYSIARFVKENINNKTFTLVRK